MSGRVPGRGAQALLGLLLAAGPAGADHVRGIRITVTSTVGTTVNFNVTLYTDGGPRFPTTPGATTPLGYGVGIFGLYGIQYGDGVVRTTAPVVGVSAGPPGLYRGSFSHTYPDTTPRTLRVASPFGVGPVNLPANAIIVGNPIFGPPGTFTANYAIAVTNSVRVLVPPVPTAPPLALWLLAAVLIAAGTLALWRRSPAL